MRVNGPFAANQKALHVDFFCQLRWNGPIPSMLIADCMRMKGNRTISEGLNCLAYGCLSAGVKRSSG